MIKFSLLNIGFVAKKFEQIDIRGTGGKALENRWSSKGLKTCLSMSVNGFPDLCFTYGSQAPTAFCNGPVCAEVQGEWIIQALDNMRSQGGFENESRRAE